MSNHPEVIWAQVRILEYLKAARVPVGFKRVSTDAIPDKQAFCVAVILDLADRGLIAIARQDGTKVVFITPHGNHFLFELLANGGCA